MENHVVQFSIEMINKTRPNRPYSTVGNVSGYRCASDCRHRVLGFLDSLSKRQYGKCSKISNTLKLRTPKIIAENNF